MFISDKMALIDQKEIANIIAQEFYSQFITLDGLNSGVPTRTTPTLTPTTLRNIEQTFIELQCEAESHQNEARFVPPLVHSIGNNQYISASDVDLHSTKSNSNIWQSSLSQSSSDSNRPTPPLTPASGGSSVDLSTTPASSTSNTPRSQRRNMGGRKPNKAANISPEEEERRVMRRERNKMAAARCRKRRVDHTNSLLQETDGLEQKKQQLQNEIQQLQTDREELEFILQNHRACCRLQNQQNHQNHQNHQNQNQQNQQNHQNQQTVKMTRALSPVDVKPYVYQMEGKQHHNDANIPRVKTELIEDTINADMIDDNNCEDDDSMMFSQPPPAKKLMLGNQMAPMLAKPNRPSSLNVPTSFVPAALHNNKNGAEIVAGIPISTPSTGIPFNFDSLMDGGTGLTPVSAPLVPSCSSQQRNLPITDLSSPDAGGPPKLVSL